MSGLIKISSYDCGFPFIVLDGVDSFDTKDIFECGQCFRWARVKMSRNDIILLDAKTEKQKKQAGFLPEDDAPGYITAAKGKVVKVFSKGDRVWILNASPEDHENIWRDYFDMDRDYESVKEELSKIDGDMKEATRRYGGIRILKQEPFETLISFIVSANNNIPRIKKIIGNLCEMFGEELEMPASFKRESDEYLMRRDFPDPERIACSCVEDISDRTHAGYRCDYILKTAGRYIDAPIDVQKLRDSSYEEAFSFVSSYTGVGPKVADCILLFTGMKDEAFPVDVWVKRVITKLYKPEKCGVNAIRQFGREYFGRYAGIAQEYLFAYIRNEDN